MAVRLAQHAQALGPRLRSIDVNPVLLNAQGEGVVALDALLEFAQGDE
jgi:hypothetical protein